MEHGEGKGQRFHCNYENCNFDAKYPQTLATHIKGEIFCWFEMFVMYKVSYFTLKDAE